MPGGEVVISQYGPLQLTGTYAATIENYFNFVRVTASEDGYVQMPLTKPISVGGQAYALSSVDVCFAQSVNLSIDETRVGWAHIGSNGFVIADLTPRSTSSGGCYSVAPTSPTAVEGGFLITLYLNFSAASVFNLTQVVTHWVPSTAP